VTNTATISLLAPTNLTAQLASNNLVLSWPVGYTGWRLQSQSPSLAAGLGTNWQTVTGAEFTNRWTMPVSAATPGAFFRLIYP